MEDSIIRTLRNLQQYMNKFEAGLLNDLTDTRDYLHDTSNMMKDLHTDLQEILKNVKTTNG
jgi:hypothetical protein